MQLGAPNCARQFERGHQLQLLVASPAPHSSPSRDIHLEVASGLVLQLASGRRRGNEESARASSSVEGSEDSSPLFVSAGQMMIGRRARPISSLRRATSWKASGRALIQLRHSHSAGRHRRHSQLERPACHSSPAIILLIRQLLRPRARLARRPCQLIASPGRRRCRAGLGWLVPI